jgi:hypothetical protein
MQFVIIDAIQRKAAMVAAIQAAIIAKVKLKSTQAQIGLIDQALAAHQSQVEALQAVAVLQQAGWQAGSTVTEIEEQSNREYNLSEAARLLDVAYNTAKRLCLAHGCARYPCGPGDDVIFPGDKLKRRATRTRMTWKITDADIAEIRLRMRGTAKLAA